MLVMVELSPSFLIIRFVVILSKKSFGINVVSFFELFLKIIFIQTGGETEDDN